MDTTVTKISFFNNVSQPTSNQILLFLQPVNPQDNYVYNAWNVMNPSIGSYQSTELSTSYAASIAIFDSNHRDFTAPVALPLGFALEITNPNNQSPVIGGKDPDASINGDQVGLHNNATTPPTHLSVTWYVNGKPVVETNNTAATTLNPGFDTTFELQQSIYCMLGQKPLLTDTFTVQDFSNKISKFPIPAGPVDPEGFVEVNVEVFTDSNGIDTFRLSDKSLDELAAAQREAKAKPRAKAA